MAIIIMNHSKNDLIIPPSWRIEAHKIDLLEIFQQNGEAAQKSGILASGSSSAEENNSLMHIF